MCVLFSLLVSVVYNFLVFHLPSLVMVDTCSVTQSWHNMPDAVRSLQHGMLTVHFYTGQCTFNVEE